MNDKLNVGDPVIVLDAGLLAMQKIMSPGSKPNNWGWVHKFLDNGEIMIEFPIGNDDPDKHSQIAPYPSYLVRRNPKGKARK